MTDDRELVAALRAEAYRVPLTLDASTLHERFARERAPKPLVRVVAVLAAALGVVALALVLGRPGQPFMGGPTSSPVTTGSRNCPLSEVVQHGSWWKEIGGPGVYFNLEPTSLYAGPNAWLVITRFDPEAGSPERVSMWAQQLPTGQPVDAAYNSPMDPANIYHFADPAPALPGGWYLFEQRLPQPGCWRLTGAIDERPVGSAVIEVAPGAAPFPTGSPGPPTPQVAPTTDSFAPGASN